MNLNVKRCLLGLVAWATLFGMAQAQYQEPAGTVQLGQPANGGPLFPPGPTPMSELGSRPLPNGLGSMYNMTQIDRVFTPRVNIDSRGGDLYGYSAGYANIGAFLPYRLEDNALLFVHGMGMVTYDGRGGATVGTGWRYWQESLDRLVGLSVWFDFDNGHAQPFQQVGLSFESLGRYVDYRVNGYIPISNPEHVLYSQATNNAVLNGSGIGFIRNNTVEQSYTGLDAEVGGPTPWLGRYGLNAYIGGYYFTGNGTLGGDFAGVSGRILSQINEDVQFGVQVTDDHVFGLNTQFQVFMNLPDGKPSYWFRNPTVRNRLNQNVFRQNRVIARTQSYQSLDAAINPTTHKPYFVANIDPNATTGGNGSVLNPFSSMAQYEALTANQQRQYDIILVRPRTDSTNKNLDTGTGFTLFDGQRLLSTAREHTFYSDNFPGQATVLPGFTGGSQPKLFSSAGDDVITLASGNTRNMEVSGFDITGSATGNGIRGNNNLGVTIDQNDIHGGLNGVLLTNLSGTITGGKVDTGSEFKLTGNNIHDNIGNGVQVTNSGTNPGVPKLDVVVQGNTFNLNGNDGLQMTALANGKIGGIIGGPSTGTTNALANTFSNNVLNGLDLIANGGRLDFGVAPTTTTSTSTTTITPLFGVPDNAFGIYNNIFTSNKLDGLHINTTNNSVSQFLVVNNSFGLQATTTSGNGQYGLGLSSDSGITNIVIGGDLIKNADGTTTSPGNLFYYNTSAINLAVAGTGTLSYDILNNTVANVIHPSTAAPHGSFTFTFDGTSGTDPFVITNTSDPGINITNVTWNLLGTVATIAPTTLPSGANPVVIQPIAGDTLLSTINGVPVVTGSSPLTTVGPPPVIANNANTGIAANSQTLNMGFNGFIPTDVFKATARFQQVGLNAALGSASTNGSQVSVTFSDPTLGVSTARVTQFATGAGVTAQGDVFGTSTPGSGSGGSTNVLADGIHVIASGTSNLDRANILDNTVSGYGNYGIHVETAGSAKAPNVIVANNSVTQNGIGVNTSGTPIFSGGGIDIERRDSSTLSAYLATNQINSNFNNGLVLTASGTSTGSLNVYSTDNTMSNNAANGLKTEISGGAIFNFTSNRDILSQNGSASGKSLNPTGGDNISINVAGTSVANITLNNISSTLTSGSGLSKGGLATGSGLSATTNDASTLNLLIESPTDPLVTGVSTFSNNVVNGITLNSNGTSLMHASIYDTLMNNNGQNGIQFNRNGASLVLANITDSSLQGNSVNGLSFTGYGSDPQDPNQQFSNTPNRINLLRDVVNNNGLNGVGQGVRLDLHGDSTLVLNATATTFNSNAQNGLRISLDPGSQFGYTLGNERSTLDNVQINNNGSNGLFLTSLITPTDPNSNNSHLPFDAPSTTFMQISANTGSTEINNNGFGLNATGLSGVLLQYLGGNHDVLIEGDVAHATPQYSTVIQANADDGIHSEAGVQATTTLSLNRVLVGGPLTTNANKGDGVDFEVQSSLTIVDGASTTIWNFNGAGTGTLNVTDSSVLGNLGNGILLLGNDLDVNGRTGNSFASVPGYLNANITNSTIANNSKTGINILLEGQMGDYRTQSRFGFGDVLSTFNITNNNIVSNGQFGVRMEQNAAEQPQVRVDFLSPAQTNPATPFDPTLYQYTPGSNLGDNTDLRDGSLLSNYMLLDTVNNAKLTLTDNVIQFNGKGGDLRQADGVFIRVGTEAYLAADVERNTMTGNVANDFHVESFVQYNPTTLVSQQPNPSVGKNAPPAINSVFLDKTAQMDLRFIGNIGNTINIQSPLVNTNVVNGTFIALQGNSTPNGAFVGANNATNSDPLKDNFGAFGFANPSPRMVQLFQVDDGANLNANNIFTQNGTTQDLQLEFYRADWHLRTVKDPLFPNPLFPQDYLISPGNPFLP